ncbi:Mu transposase C-terminal domain-containing protein [Saccharopolyspora pogona]|uniref:Mu transposase C-terminal domain-containing protein n=1 Tax=Saccharopolyspora pogona TaxID=333966 RepID=UPI001CC2323F|nr:Mu transposase C-terminal domain-containing protein [Saccharopolyspora pogona]
MRDQFLVEITGDDEPGRHQVTDLLELNRLFTAWVETVYHRRVHSETGQAPLQRWMTGGPIALPTPAALAEAFRWEARRTVRKTATVSLHGNVYEVDPALVGRAVELVFDPFDLTRLEVRHRGQSWGLAIPHHIGRHAHPKARPEIPPEPPKQTGIDYTHLVDATHQADLAGGITAPRRRGIFIPSPSAPSTAPSSARFMAANSGTARRKSSRDRHQRTAHDRQRSRELGAPTPHDHAPPPERSTPRVTAI